MAISFMEREVYSVEKDMLKRSELLLFFSSTHNRESLVAVYDRCGKYEGVISYQSLLQNESIEAALVREKVFFDKNIWTNVSDTLSLHKNIKKIPVLAADDTILCFAEDSPRLTRLMMELCELAKDNRIWTEMRFVHIKGMNEVLFYLEKLLKRKGISVSVEGALWESFGESTLCGESGYLQGLQIVDEDGGWIDQMYNRLESGKRISVWNWERWDHFCQNIKEKDEPVILGVVPGAASEQIYNAFLQKEIFPESIVCQSQVHALFGRKVKDLHGILGGIWCLAGAKDDARMKAMLEAVVREQEGDFERIFFLSGVERILPDEMLKYMIQECGRVFLTGEKRICALFATHCTKLGEVEVAYVEKNEKATEKADEDNVALWFYFDFPTQEAVDQFNELSSSCMQEGIYLSRYFLNHFNYFEYECDTDCFTNEEIVKMNNLKQMQVYAEECSMNQFKCNQGKRSILFMTSGLSYLWDGLFPLFNYYVMRTDTECTVMFPSIESIIGVGERNLKETVECISEIKKLGGSVSFYNNWYLDRKFDVCYTSLGFSGWYEGGNGIDIHKASKIVISLQTTGFHTHYYIGNQGFEDMFGKYQKETDYAIVSKFMAEWAVQRDGKWKEKLLPFGYPRMDRLYEDLHSCRISDEWKKKAEGKRVIYSTAYSVDLFMYCLEYCKEDKLLLIWRPHPYDFDSYRTRDRIEEWKSKENIIIDTNQSYSAAFCISDALISTFSSSVQINYLFTEKPILILDKGYLGIKNEINFQEEAWYKAAYAANDEKACKEFVDMIMDGRDDKREEKLPYRQFMQQGFDGRVCDRIVQFIDGKFGETCLG